MEFALANAIIIKLYYIQTPRFQKSLQNKRKLNLIQIGSDR